MYIIDYKKSVGENLGQMPGTEDKGLPVPLAIVGAFAILWVAYKILK
jgi:hypothetical protein